MCSHAPIETSGRRLRVYLICSNNLLCYCGGGKVGKLTLRNKRSSSSGGCGSGSGISFEKGSGSGSCRRSGSGSGCLFGTVNSSGSDSGDVESMSVMMFMSIHLL